MKIAITIVLMAVLAFTADAAPTENTYAAVTNDWYNGNWTNVLELAQIRRAANSNDLVAANIIVSYDVLFSDVGAMSNSVTRLIDAMDQSSAPALTNLHFRLRPGWVYFRDQFLPYQTAADLQQQHEKSYITHKPIDCDFVLKAIWDNGLW